MQCTNCTTCAADEYAIEFCEIEHDRKCAACTICELGEDEYYPCTDKSDTVCSKILFFT